MSAKDKMQMADVVSAGISREVTPPRFPCPKCGKETKEAQPVLDDDGNVIEKRRVCSSKNCREIITAV